MKATKKGPSFSVTLMISVKLFVIETWGHVLYHVRYGSDFHYYVVVFIDCFRTCGEVERIDADLCKLVDGVRRYVYRGGTLLEACHVGVVDAIADYGEVDPGCKLFPEVRITRLGDFIVFCAYNFKYPVAVSSSSVWILL